MTNEKRCTWFGFVIAATVVCIVGCNNNPKTVTVKGQVLLDGQPLPNVIVTFMPSDGSRSATATTDEEGRFYDASSFQKNDGAVPGSHRVAINPKDPPPMPGMSGDPGSPGGDAATYAPPFPERYTIPANSGLEAEVEVGGANDFTFELKSK